MLVFWAWIFVMFEEMMLGVAIFGRRSEDIPYAWK
jgi:hypothetical protein